MCDRCAALEDEVTYLRERLGDRLDADIVRILTKTFRFTSYESRVIAILYKARGLVRTYELETAARDDHTRDYALSANTVAVMVSRIRKKVGHAFLQTIRAHGFALSDDARLAIARAIEADKQARTAEDIVVTPICKTWTPQAVGKLAQMRRQGWTYAECARAFKVSRNAAIGAGNRYLNDGAEA